MNIVKIPQQVLIQSKVSYLLIISSILVLTLLFLGNGYGTQVSTCIHLHCQSHYTLHMMNEFFSSYIDPGKERF